MLGVRVMKGLGCILSAGVLILSGVANAQPFQLGRTLSSAFLERLARPRPGSSDVAVIHVEVGSAMIIERDPPNDRVAYLRGSPFVWGQISEQISAASAHGEPLHLEVRRWNLNTESCPALGERLAAFLRELDETVANLGAADTVNRELVVDAPTFMIELAAKDSLVTITPDGPLNPPLQRAALELHSVVSRCSASEVPSVEQHDF